METSDILVQCESGHIGPEALYIGQVRRTDVFRIDWNMNSKSWVKRKI